LLYSLASYVKWQQPLTFNKIQFNCNNIDRYYLKILSKKHLHLDA
jgi:hypothetical protein